MKARYQVLSEKLREELLAMDEKYRTTMRARYTPDEIAQVLKALRMLDLSVEARGLDACFEGGAI